MSIRKRTIRGFGRNTPIQAQWSGDQNEQVKAITKLIEDLDKKADGRWAQIDQLSGDMTALQAHMTALRVGGGGDAFDPKERETRNAFSQFARKGIQAAMTTDSGPDGGFLVPKTLENTIAEIARDYSPLRQLASVKQIGQGVGTYSKLVRISGATSEWRGETDAPSDTDQGQYSELTPPEGELTAMPRIAQWLLDDSQFNVEEELGGDVARSFAVAEGAAFVNGTGIKKPRGFLQSTMIANASWAWGKLGFIVTGDANGFLAASATVSGADVLIDLIYSLKAEYRQTASWIMNSATAAIVRKFKDQDGNYIWSTALQAGEPDMLLGFPVYHDENMPAVAAGNFPIAFGNWNRGYLIVDRLGVRVLRDPYTSKPYVKFYTTKRIGGMVQDFAAIKLLKVSA